MPKLTIEVSTEAKRSWQKEADRDGKCDLEVWIKRKCNEASGFEIQHTRDEINQQRYWDKTFG